MSARLDASDLPALLAEAGLHSEAEAARSESLPRSRASELSVDFCQRGFGRLATLLARYAHPLPER